MALKGTLEEISLRELFQIFDMGEKSGRLLLANGSDYGLIYVCAGQLIDALIMSRDNPVPRAAREQAVHQLLGWDDTTTFLFTYDPEVTRRPVRIQHSSGWFVLENLRRQDSPQPHSAAGLTSDTMIEPGVISNSADIALGLDLEQWRILDLVVRGMPIREVTTTLKLNPDAALHVITELVEIGLLQVGASPAPRHSLETRPHAHIRLSMDMPPTAPIHSSLVQAIRHRIQRL